MFSIPARFAWFFFVCLTAGAPAAHAQAVPVISEQVQSLEPQARDAPIDPAKRADIERLMEKTNALALGTQVSATMVTQMLQQMRARRPDIPQRALDIVAEEVKAAINDQIPLLKEQVIVLYDRYFSAEDLHGLVRFYSTPLGEKVLRTLPLISREMAPVGMRWGREMQPEIARRIQRRFAAEHIDPKTFDSPGPLSKPIER
jgi:hypothetical protein